MFVYWLGALSAVIYLASLSGHIPKSLTVCITTCYNSYFMGHIAINVHKDLNTVEPLYNGHFWGPTFCPL